jgi:hypothetical protein
MSDISLQSPPATARESSVLWETPKPSIHEFWTRAGEVKNLVREFERLKQQAAPAATAGA